MTLESFKTGFFPGFKPGFSKALELMKRCAKIQGIGNLDPGQDSWLEP
jgi:hypothetical protein